MKAAVRLKEGGRRRESSMGARSPKGVGSEMLLITILLFYATLRQESRACVTEQRLMMIITSLVGRSSFNTRDIFIE